MEIVNFSVKIYNSLFQFTSINNTNYLVTRCVDLSFLVNGNMVCKLSNFTSTVFVALPVYSMKK